MQKLIVNTQLFLLQTKYIQGVYNWKSLLRIYLESKKANLKNSTVFPYRKCPDLFSELYIINCYRLNNLHDNHLIASPPSHKFKTNDPAAR